MGAGIVPSNLPAENLLPRAEATRIAENGYGGGLPAGALLAPRTLLRTV